MSLDSNEGIEHVDFTISWQEYACLKKVDKKGCCAEDCAGCCYVPKHVKKGNKKVDPAILNQLRFIVPEFAPNPVFHQTLLPYQQANLCRVIRTREATQENWNLYFGKDQIYK